MDDLLGCKDVHEFAKKYARHRAVVRSVKISGVYVRKAFLGHCPRCFCLLPSMLTADGIEACVSKSCDYERVIFTHDERSFLGWF
jgi:hypothetical protein